MSSQTNKEQFREFLARKVERESTINQYIAWMNKVQDWFIEKKIVKKEFNIWNDIDKIQEIQISLENTNKTDWKADNKVLKNWMSSPWNAWVSFNNNLDIKELEINSLEISFPFDINQFQQDLKKAGLLFSEKLINRCNNLALKNWLKICI